MTSEPDGHPIVAVVKCPVDARAAVSIALRRAFAVSAEATQELPDGRVQITVHAAGVLDPAHPDLFEWSPQS